MHSDSLEVCVCARTGVCLCVCVCACVAVPYVAFRDIIIARCVHRKFSTAPVCACEAPVKKDLFSFCCLCMRYVGACVCMRVYVCVCVCVEKL